MSLTEVFEFEKILDYTPSVVSLFHVFGTTSYQKKVEISRNSVLKTICRIYIKDLQPLMSKMNLTI